MSLNYAMKKKIAVVGGGIVGMSTALFLKERFDVTLFEREAHPVPLGAGIMLQPSGLNVLRKLGVLDEVYARGQLIEGFLGENITGSIDFNIDFSKHKGGVYGLGVQRGSIFFALLNKVKSTSIQFETGQEIIDFKTQKSKTVLISKTGEDFGAYDFTLVANGARSSLREKFSNFYFSRLSGQGAIWTKVNPSQSSPKNRIHQIYDGTQKMLGLMPIGSISDTNTEKKLNFFFGTSLQYIKQWHNKNLLEWKAEVLSVSKEFKQYTDQIQSKDDLVCAPYFDVWAKKYYQNNFLFIGDAAHAMGPHLSSGTNLGLLDALCLDLLFRDTTDHKSVFVNFQKQREDQLKYYQSISRYITPYFQSETDKSFVRSYILKYLYKLPKVSDIMVQTITGRRKTMFETLPDSLYLPKP